MSGGPEAEAEAIWRADRDKWRDMYRLMEVALEGIGKALFMDPQGLLEDPSSAANALRNVRLEERQQAADFAEACIANGVTVLSAREVGDAIRNREPKP